jgi:iron complex outermembrane receptor protein
MPPLAPFLRHSARLLPFLLAADALAQSPSQPTALPEVTVRAQLVDEKAADVPISLRVFGAEELRRGNFERTEDVLRATPSVTFTNEGATAFSGRVYIRGVGSAVRWVDQSVGFYVDDVFVGSNVAINAALLDLDRVEVLRGPQGTLYGRSATGGAVNVSTSAPTAQPSYALSTAFGSNNLMRLGVVANQPLAGGTVLSRFALSHVSDDGYVQNLFGGPKLGSQDNTAGRVRLAYFPGTATEVDLSADFSRDVNARRYAYGTFAQALSLQANTFSPFVADREVGGLSARVRHNMGGYSLQSISAFRFAREDSAGSGFAPANNEFQGVSVDQWQGSQEFRIVSPREERLRWIAGALVARNDTETLNFYQLNNFGPGFGLPFGYREQSLAKVKSDTFALFGDVTWGVAPRLDATIGARLSYDRKSLSYAHTQNFPAAFVVAAPIVSRAEDATFTNLSPKFTVSYRATQNTLLYGTLSRGYKPGGFNVAFVGSPNFRFEDETVNNLEFGVRTQAADGRFSLSAAVFQMDWRNQQLNIREGANVFRTANADRSESRGFEVEVVGRPSRGVEFGGGVAYVDSTIKRFPTFSNLPGATVEGNRQPFAAEWTGAFYAQLTHPLQDGWRFVGRIDYSATSQVFFNIENRLRQGGYGLLGARIGLEDRNYGVFLYGRNLTDERYIVEAFGTGAGARAAPGEPRIIGIALSARI